MERVALYAINTLAGGPPVKALMSPEIAGDGLEEERRARRPGERAREVHGLLLLRVDLDAEQHEPAPQRLLQGLRQGAADCRSARWTRSIPWISGTGWTASARPATSCSPSRTTPISPTAACIPTEVDTKGRPIDAAYAASRDRNEPLIEIKQLKGTSETHPLLSPNDEFASFEIMSVLLGNPPGRIPHIVGSYARQALKDGLALQDTQGLQPVQVRLRRRVRLAQHRRPVPPGQLLRRSFLHGRDDRGAHVRHSGRRDVRRAHRRHRRADRRVGRGEHARLALRGACSARRPSPSAARTSRCACSAAGSTPRTCWPTRTGSRPATRRACRWAAICRRPRRKAPTFIVWAVKDPTSGNLDRIQIVKGWTQERPELREDLRRRLGRRPQARQVDRRRAADRQHGGRRERDLHEHDRRGRS